MLLTLCQYRTQRFTLPGRSSPKIQRCPLLINSPEDITEVGEQEVWGGSIKRPRSGLNILQGHYYLEKKVNSEDDEADNLEKSIVLAKKALEKLN